MQDSASRAARRRAHVPHIPCDVERALRRPPVLWGDQRTADANPSIVPNAGRSDDDASMLARRLHQPLCESTRLLPNLYAIHDLQDLSHRSGREAIIQASKVCIVRHNYSIAEGSRHERTDEEQVDPRHDRVSVPAVVCLEKLTKASQLKQSAHGISKAALVLGPIERVLYVAHELGQIDLLVVHFLVDDRPIRRPCRPRECDVCVDVLVLAASRPGGSGERRKHEHIPSRKHTAPERRSPRVTEHAVEEDGDLHGLYQNVTDIPPHGVDAPHNAVFECVSVRNPYF